MKNSNSKSEAVAKASIATKQMLGEGTIRALRILEQTDWNCTMSAQGFARQMWPDSPMHTKRSKGGHGTQIGKAAWLVGGSFLAKLVSKGLVCRDFVRLGNGFYISSNGREALRACT